MKRAFLLVSLWCSGAFAQGFEVSDQEQEQEQQEAAPGDGAWQPVPPPPPTEEEISQDPMVNEQAQPPAQAPTQQQFEQELSPYGQWVDDPNVGRVWRPDPNEVGEDFTPYSTGGTWGYTNYGWSFSTGWSWGWAPFHYGRWYRHASWGWVWWPSYTWGSSWVDWRYSRGYVGWAPLGPPGYSAQFGLGVPGWSFCARNSFWHPYVSHQQIYPRYAGGRYSWYHAPTYRSAPMWRSVSRSWRQPSWHNTPAPNYRANPSYRGGARSPGVRVGGGGHHPGGRGR